MRLSNAILGLLLSSVAISQTLPPQVRDIPYGVSWDGVKYFAPSMNVLYDKIEAIIAGAVDPILSDIVTQNPGADEMLYWVAPGTSAALVTSAFMRGLMAAANSDHVRPSLDLPTIDVRDHPYHAAGNGVADDTASLQAAIDAVVAAGGGTVYLPSGSFLITATLTVGDGTTGVNGLTIASGGFGQSEIVWGGAGADNMIELLGCTGTTLENVTLDGMGIAGTTGIYHTTGAATASMYTMVRNCAILNCPAGGYRVRQWSATATCDFLTFDNCNLSYNGLYALKIEGGVRQCDIRGGSIVSNTQYGIHLVDGRFCAYDTTFALNSPAYAAGTATFTQTSTTVTGAGTAWTAGMAGRRIRRGTATKWYTIQSVTNATTLVLTGAFAEASGADTYQIIDDTAADVYVDGEIASFAVYGGTSESLKFLTGDWVGDAGWSRLLQPNIISGLNQANHDLAGGISAVDISVDYDCSRPLILTGCKFHGDVQLGSKCSSVMSFHTDFFNWERSAGDPDPITGFIGAGANAVSMFGRTDNSVGDGSITGQLLLGGGTLMVSTPSSWINGIDIRSVEGTVYRRIGFADASPDTYYAAVGWIAYNVNPGADEPLGWRCLIAGDGPAESVKSTWQPFFADANGYSVPPMHITMTIVDDGDWANEAVSIWQAPAAGVTITSVRAAVVGSSTPTLTYNIEERAYNTINSAGTDIYASDQVADADEEIETAFSNDAIAANNRLVFTTGAGAESGTVDQITLTIYYE